MRERLRSYPARGESRDPTPPALACPARPPPGAKVRARPRGRSPGPGRARWGRGPGRRPPRPPACIPRASGRGAALSSPRRARLCHGARLGTHWKPASRCRDLCGGLGPRSPAAPPRPRPPPPRGPALLEPDSVPRAGGPGSGCRLAPSPGAQSCLFSPPFPRSKLLAFSQRGFVFHPESLDNPATTAAEAATI